MTPEKRAAFLAFKNKMLDRIAFAMLIIITSILFGVLGMTIYAIITHTANLP